MEGRPGYHLSRWLLDPAVLLTGVVSLSCTGCRDAGTRLTSRKRCLFFLWRPVRSFRFTKMGLGNSKNGSSKHASLSEDEQRRLRKVFQVAAKESNHCTQMNIQQLWSDINDHLLDVILKYYFTKGKVIDFETFIKPYLNIVKGTIDDKMEVLQIFLKSEEGFRTKDVLEYVHSIVDSFLRNLQNDANFKSWKDAGCSLSESQLRMFSNFLCHDLPRTTLLTLEQLSTWIPSWSSLLAMEKAVFRNLYGTTDLEPQCEIRMPKCIGMNNVQAPPSILNLSHIMFLNSHLPKELRDEWRFLFSTKVHGESFSKLLGCINNQGPSLIFIEDRSGHVFGGFAPESWNIGPSFVGNPTCFLFKLKPCLSVYHPSCYNEHYQYLNINQQTMPNGLGMGGQLDYFGLWLDADFGTGHSSESCTTFRGYQMLSGEKCFEIDHVEVWGVGKPPSTDEEEGGRSVLDDPRNIESKAMLEMMGKTQYSEGLREPED